VKLTLLGYWRSSASYRVRIGLGLKGLPYEYVAVNLVAPGGGEQLAEPYRARNPMGQVPTLLVEEADGATATLRQSLPILEYLDERWPDPPLLPADRTRRAHARALAEVVNSGIQPLQNLSVTRRLAALGVDDKAWIRAVVADGLVALERQVADTAGRFCVGDHPTVADCCLVPQLYSARRFGVDLAPCPTLTRIDAACAELAAFAAAHPDRQPDAVPPAPAPR
jgi:maleylpyruvate isomerase